jgi:hypothetical protein
VPLDLSNPSPLIPGDIWCPSPEPQGSPSSHPSLPTWWSPRSWSTSKPAPQRPRLRHDEALAHLYPTGMVPRQSHPSHWLRPARQGCGHPVWACSRVPRGAVLHWPPLAISCKGIVPGLERNSATPSSFTHDRAHSIEHLEARVFIMTIWGTRSIFILDL